MSVHIPIPDSFWDSRWHVALKGSLVVVSVEYELYISNWKECSGVKLSPYPHHPLPPIEEQSEDRVCSYFLVNLYSVLRGSR